MKNDAGVFSSKEIGKTLFEKCQKIDSLYLLKNLYKKVNKIDENQCKRLIHTTYISNNNFDKLYEGLVNNVFREMYSLNMINSNKKYTKNVKVIMRDVSKDYENISDNNFTYKLPIGGLIQYRSISDENFDIDKFIEGNIYQEFLNETRHEYNGNQSNIDHWMQILDPNITTDEHGWQTIQNDLYKNDSILMGIKNILMEPSETMDDFKSNTIIDILSLLFMKVVKRDFPTLTKEQLDEISRSCSNIFNDKYEELSGIKRKIFIDLFALLPSILSPQYEYNLGDNCISILFSSLTLYCYKKLIQSCKSGDKNSLNELEKLLNGFLWVYDNIDSITDIRELFEIVNGKNICNLLEEDINDIMSIFLCNNTSDGLINNEKSVGSTNSLGKVWRGFLDLSIKLSKIKWFDCGIFDVKSEYKYSHISFADSLIESSYIHFNCIGILNDSLTKYIWMNNSDLYTCDTTRFFNYDNKIDSTNNLSSIVNLYISVAYSIKINAISKLYDSPPILNSNIKRDYGSINIWKMFVSHYIYISSMKIYSGSIKSNVNRGKNVFYKYKLLMFACHYRTWIMDSFYWYVNYKKLMVRTSGNIKSVMELINQFNDIELKLFNDNTLFVASYVTDFVIYPLYGSYSSSVISSCIMKYLKNEVNRKMYAYNTMSYAFKDIFLFDDVSYMTDDLEYKTSGNDNYIQFDGFYQKCLNDLGSKVFEKILSKFILNLYNECIFKQCENDESIKSYLKLEFDKNIETKIHVEDLDDIESDYFCVNTFNKIIQTKNHAILNLVKKVVYFGLYINLNKNNRNVLYRKFNEYKGFSILNKTNLDYSTPNIGNIIGIGLFYLLEECSNFNRRKFCGVLSPTFRDRCRFSIEDLYIFSDGFPNLCYVTSPMVQTFMNIFTIDSDVYTCFVPKSLLNCSYMLESIISKSCELLYEDLNNGKYLEKLNFNNNNILSTMLTYISNVIINSGYIDNEEKINLFGSILKDVNELDWINALANITNIDTMIPAIVKACINDWDEKTFKMYLKDNMINLGRYFDIKSKINSAPNALNITLTNLKKEENHITKMNKSFPCWHNKVNNKLESINATTDDSKKLKEELIELSKWLAMNGNRFLFESMIPNNVLADKTLK